MAGAYATLVWDDKDPDEVLEEAIDFADALDEGDSLTSIAYTFVTQAGLTKTLERIDGTLARVRLSSGTDGQTAKLMCTVNTLSGEILQQGVKIKIKSK